MELDIHLNCLLTDVLFVTADKGADDNGSGTVVILEALRNIVESGIVLKRTVEFHWYAAEEVTNIKF